MLPTTVTKETPQELAIRGGPPVRSKPWHESNALGHEETQAALRVMESGRLSLFQGAWNPNPPLSFRGGPEVQALESLAKEKVGSMHAVAMNSATSCLTAAVGALGLGYGDEVIVSPYTMSACAVAPLWYGAIPVFADIEITTGCLDPVSIRTCITERTKAILVIHQFGIPADMDAIASIAREYNLMIIEDCAQAWGARYKGKPVGTIGSIGVFSFNVHKTIHCGEGGLCVTNNADLALRLQLIRNHGEAVVEDAGVGSIINMVGGNFRMTELQAAIAAEQVKKLHKLNVQRLALVEALSSGLRKHDCLITPDPPEGRGATYYVYPLRYLSEKNHNVPRGEFAAMLKAEGVPFSEGYVKPLYLLPLFQKRTAFKNGYPWSAPENRVSNPSYAKGTCPNAERLHFEEMLLSLFVCPPQTTEDMGDTVKAVEKVLAPLST